MAPRADNFRRGLRDLGYVEGKNIVIEWRSGEGKLDRVPALVAELLQLKVEVIVSGGPAVTRSLKAATSTIPIVMTQDTDPVGNGAISAISKPRTLVLSIGQPRADPNAMRLSSLTL